MKYFLIAVVFSTLLSAVATPASADVSVSISAAPPMLPVYEQPILPGDGYIWTPGYWAYGDGDYYWVPGTWIYPPRVGYLWTPGYWYWSNSFYVFRSGYWGTHVGYYGGVNYGYGYNGRGYEGGRWERGRFSYNRSVNHINERNVHNSYRKAVANNNHDDHTSYNGGHGGINAHPSVNEMTRRREAHVGATNEQINHEKIAHTKPELRQSANHGNPPIAATRRPSAFNDAGTEASRDHSYQTRNRRNESQGHHEMQRPNMNMDRPHPPDSRDNQTRQPRSMQRMEQNQQARPRQQQPRQQDHQRQQQQQRAPQEHQHQEQGR